MDISKHFGSSSGKANNPKKERNYREISWLNLQCSGSSQIPTQDDANYHQFLSLYKTRWRNLRTELIIYDIENNIKKIKILDTKIILDFFTSITQLPNGELFCYGSSCNPGIRVIIDRNYEARMLPFEAKCYNSLALYFDKAIYCFGGWLKCIKIALSRKFDLEKNKWINLTMLPEVDTYCNSVIFNGNILISGEFCKNLWLYSIEIDSFSRISYEFKAETRKLLINVEKLYLIESNNSGWIYESEDEYHWMRISKSEKLLNGFCQTYCLYYKKKIYISTGISYCHFDLKKKVVLELSH